MPLGIIWKPSICSSADWAKTNQGRLLHLQKSDRIVSINLTWPGTYFLSNHLDQSVKMRSTPAQVILHIFLVLVAYLLMNAGIG
jgi:hypothetical protein